MIILTATSGQQYAVDDEFIDRLDARTGVDYVDTDGDNWLVKGSLADLIEFLVEEGVV